jgi:hypothetical protein
MPVTCEIDSSNCSAQEYLLTSNDLPAEPPSRRSSFSFGARGCFTDCYALEVPAPVTQAQFVEAFYTTLLFKAERFILKLLADGRTRAIVQGPQDHALPAKGRLRRPRRPVYRD